MEKQSYFEFNQDQLKAFKQLPRDSPVIMMNLLKFKDRVHETGLSGEASYKEYMRQAAPFFEKVNAEIIYLGKPQAMLIGPADEGLWDKVLLIKYDSISDFLIMLNGEGYPIHLRKQALEDSRLIHCQ